VAARPGFWRRLPLITTRRERDTRRARTHPRRRHRARHRRADRTQPSVLDTHPHRSARLSTPPDQQRTTPTPSTPTVRIEMRSSLLCHCGCEGLHRFVSGCCCGRPTRVSTSGATTRSLCRARSSATPDSAYATPA